MCYFFLRNRERVMWCQIWNIPLETFLLLKLLVPVGEVLDFKSFLRTTDTRKQTVMVLEDLFCRMELTGVNELTPSERDPHTHILLF